MKHKLINIETKETHLCERLSIGGFDYYVSGEKPEDNDNIIYKNGNTYHFASFREGYYYDRYDCKKIIATTNPDMDCPKVVGEVNEIKKNLFFYKQVMNPYETEGQSYTAYEKGFIEGYNKSQETHSSTDEDMIEFAEWLDNNKQQREYHPMSCMSQKELLQLFKQQQPKTIYFN